MVVIDHLNRIRRLKPPWNTSKCLNIFFLKSFKLIIRIISNCCSYLFRPLSRPNYLLIFFVFLTRLSSQCDHQDTNIHWNNYKILEVEIYVQNAMQSEHLKEEKIFFYMKSLSVLRLCTYLNAGVIGTSTNWSRQHLQWRRQQTTVVSCLYYIRNNIIGINEMKYKNSFFLISSHGIHKPQHNTLKLFIQNGMA